MQIKAQGILNASTWIRSEFGQAALDRVLDRCGSGVRERCATAIAINWHPVEEFIDFLGSAEQVLGTGDGKLAEHLGEEGARSNLKGALVRMTFWLANPDFLMRRVAGLWQQFNDEGQMAILQADNAVRKIEVSGIAQPNWLFCCTITGWAHVTTQAAGVSNPLARHTECRARGGDRCVWEIQSRP